ncbi:MAG: methyltransferase domain-containing protein, partial [Anaerorhabdus sp.]|uniref:methyltransferase domain-containing protein n=1 Tax=Anaerorhabdus sp. TaxID=1872524 RepID=UPI003A863CB6
GPVLGIDASPQVVADATRLVGDRPNLRFTVGDAYALEHPDASFDVVHAHQVLQHLTDPVAALRELRRVLAPGGVLAARDANYAAFWWSPNSPRLDRWLDLYHRVTATNRADADAGRHLLGWAHAAGFDDVTYSSSTWTFASPQDRAWWAGTWQERAVASSFAHQAVGYGLATADDLAEIAAGFADWAASPDAVFVVPHGEITARR